ACWCCCPRSGIPGPQILDWPRWCRIAGSRWGLTGIRRLRDVLHARSRHAGDEPRAALERYVIPGPVQRDDQAVSKADQEVDVRDAPYDPGDEAGNLQSADLDDGAPAPDGRKRAEIPVAERRRRVAPRTRNKETGNILALLLGDRCDARERIAV